MHDTHFDIDLGFLSSIVFERHTNLKLTVLFKCSIFKIFFAELLKVGLATLQLSLNRAQYDIFTAICPGVCDSDFCSFFVTI